MDELLQLAARPVSSLTRLEKQWCKRRHCGFCEASLLGQQCYAMSGKYVLPAMQGVRSRAKTIELGPPCNMDQRRAQALQHYKPRAKAHLNEGAEG